MSGWYGTRKRTDEEILESVKRNKGNLTEIMKDLGYKSRHTVKQRIDKNSEIKRVYDSFSDEERNLKGYGQGRIKHTDEEIKEAIIKAGGIISQAADMLGYASYHSLHKRISQNPELKKAQLEAKERGIDIAETQLMKLVKKGDFQAVRFFLTTQGRSRGYGDRVEIGGRVDFNQNWNLQLLGIDELLMLEAIANKVAGFLESGDEDDNTIDGHFIEKSTQLSSN